MEITTDCRTEDGITVGIVDAFITLLRLFQCRDLSSDAVKEALKDLSSDEDYLYLANLLEELAE